MKKDHEYHNFFKIGIITIQIFIFYTDNLIAQNNPFIIDDISF